MQNYAKINLNNLLSRLEFIKLHNQICFYDYLMDYSNLMKLLSLLIFVCFEQNVDNIDVQQCLFDQHNITAGKKFNKDVIIHRLRKKFNLTNETVTHITTMLDQCEKLNHSLSACLRDNSDRFGLLPHEKFDPLLKTELSLSDILIDNELYKQCTNGNGKQIMNLEDVFVRMTLN